MSAATDRPHHRQRLANHGRTPLRAVVSILLLVSPREQRTDRGVITACLNLSQAAATCSEAGHDVHGRLAKALLR